MNLPMQSVTTEDLLLYMYGETSQEKTQIIKDALESDWSLRDNFEALVTAAQQLDTISVSPRQQTIDNIMNYAEKAIEEHSHA